MNGYLGGAMIVAALIAAYRGEGGACAALVILGIAVLFLPA